MSDKTELSWQDYEKIVNGEFTDIVISKSSLSKILRKKKTSIRLPNYQVSFLEKKYPPKNLSEALRLALDDLIKINGKENKKE